MAIKHLLTAIIAASVASASSHPAKDVVPQGGVKVEQVRNPTYRRPHGAIALARAYKKYNMKVPTHVAIAAASAAAVAAATTSTSSSTTRPTSTSTSASTATQTGSVNAVPQSYDYEYLEPITIGSTTFSMDFDTGSSDFWVYGSNYSSTHHTYSPGTTGKLYSGESWAINYGDGSSASGIVYNDTVKVGAVTATSENVEVATSAAASLTSDPLDGVLGLGFASGNSCSPKRCTTFFDKLAPSLASKVFTANLRHNATGFWSFGYVNSTTANQAFTYAPITSSGGYWNFTPSSYQVAGKQYVAPTSVLYGIADSGTTLILADDSICQNYYDQVNGAQLSNSDGGWVFPCNATLPTFGLVINGHTATVPGPYMNYAPNGDGTCYGGIQSDDGQGLAIYGDIFLKSQYVVFDQTQSAPRIGFANKNLP